MYAISEILKKELNPSDVYLLEEQGRFVLLPDEKELATLCFNEGLKVGTFSEGDSSKFFYVVVTPEYLHGTSSLEDPEEFTWTPVEPTPLSAEYLLNTSIKTLVEQFGISSYEGEVEAISSIMERNPEVAKVLDTEYMDIKELLKKTLSRLLVGTFPLNTLLIVPEESLKGCSEISPRTVQDLLEIRARSLLFSVGSAVEPSSASLRDLFQDVSYPVVDVDFPDGFFEAMKVSPITNTLLGPAFREYPHYKKFLCNLVNLLRDVSRENFSPEEKVAEFLEGSSHF